MQNNDIDLEQFLLFQRIRRAVEAGHFAKKEVRFLT